jgi:hypothetical protein
MTCPGFAFSGAAGCERCLAFPGDEGATLGGGAALWAPPMAFMSEPIGSDCAAAMFGTISERASSPVGNETRVSMGADFRLIDNDAK